MITRPRTTHVGLLAAAWFGLWLSACGGDPASLTVVMRDGTVVVGHVEGATSRAVMVRDADGVLHELVREDIVSMATGPPDEAAPGGDADTTRPRSPAAREVTVAAGVVLKVMLDQPLLTTTGREGDAIEAHLMEAVTIDGIEVVPVDARVGGRVVGVRRAGADGTPSQLTLAFDSLQRRGGTALAIATEPVVRQGRVVKPDVNRVVGALRSVVGRRPRDVAEELTLTAGTTFEVTLIEPVGLPVPAIAPAGSRGAARPSEPPRSRPPVVPRR